MRVKLFTFRFSPTLGAFDEGPLLDFVRDKELLGFREHFFTVADVPHLACVVTYQDAVVPPEALAEARAIAAGAREAPSHAPLPPPGPRDDGNGRRPRFGRDDRDRRDDRERPDPTAGMNETDRALFNTLREWRVTTARREGVPPFVIFSNRELARLVVVKPENPTRLGQIEGIGGGKVERYGAAVLGLLHGKPTALPTATSTPLPTSTSTSSDAPMDASCATSDAVDVASSVPTAGPAGGMS